MDPLTIGAGLASVGAAGLGAAANGQVGAARHAAEMAELQRQSRWDDQIRQLQQQSLGRFDDFAPKMSERAGSVADFYKASGGALPSSGVTAGVLPQSDNVALLKEGGRQMGKVDAFNTQQGKALGNLRSFGDIMGNANRGMAIDNGFISGINSEKQGSASILASELEAANKAGDGLKTFADILGGLGKVGMTAGLGGGWDKLFGVTNIGPTGASMASELAGGLRPV